VRALLIVFVLVAGSVGAQEKGAEAKRTISVTGQGEVKAVPDRAALSFAVETTGERAGAAVAENAKRSAAVAAALKAALGAEGTVGTSRYAIEPRYDVLRPGETREPHITGYVVRNEVRADGTKADKVGALIDAATGAGANRIGGLSFTFSNHDELERAALEKAGADARAQAESVARGLGVRLKAVVSAVVGSRPVPFGPRVQAMEMAQARAVPTPVEAGEETVSATLQVVYEIE
jgi:uncharacterized protein